MPTGFDDDEPDRAVQFTLGERADEVSLHDGLLGACLSGFTCYRRCGRGQVRVAGQDEGEDVFDVAQVTGYGSTVGAERLVIGALEEVLEDGELVVELAERAGDDGFS